LRNSDESWTKSSNKSKKMPRERKSKMKRSGKRKQKKLRLRRGNGSLKEVNHNSSSHHWMTSVHLQITLFPSFLKKLSGLLKRRVWTQRVFTVYLETERMLTCSSKNLKKVLDFLFD